jgi:hypothetical protein
MHQGSNFGEIIANQSGLIGRAERLKPLGRAAIIRPISGDLKMPQYRSIIRMQAIGAAMQEFDSGLHESIGDAQEKQCELIGAHMGHDAAWGGDFLADMEMHGKLEERIYCDGRELSGDEIADLI